ncbi:MAG TPA: vWA domain-containing protein [Syntrophomonas sp.]|jgi:uncharacterized protein YegL|nr:vWA domain-containing protein [Syntrophomonas sp.]
MKIRRITIMKKELTELVFILDRSGSMAGLESAAISSFNSMLQKQQQEPGEAIVTTALFNDEYELLHDRSDLKDIRSLTAQEYYARGNTALLDAIGKTIRKIAAARRQTDGDEITAKVIVVIITDGKENASLEYSSHIIKTMVEEQKRLYGWKFIFLGANLDAIAAAARIGISADHAADYCADSAGIRLSFEAVSEAISDLRAGGEIKNSWRTKINEDYSRRMKE